MHHIRYRLNTVQVALVTLGVIFASLSCASEVPVTVEIIREVPVTVEVTREVPATVEVTREVPATVEVTREVPATVEVTREVPVTVEATQSSGTINEIEVTNSPTSLISMLVDDSRNHQLFSKHITGYCDTNLVASWWSQVANLSSELGTEAATWSRMIIEGTSPSDNLNSAFTEQENTLFILIGQLWALPNPGAPFNDSYAAMIGWLNSLWFAIDVVSQGFIDGNTELHDLGNELLLRAQKKQLQMFELSLQAQRLCGFIS